jgi:predicted histone-like DNA-binding protein
MAIFYKLIQDNRRNAANPGSWYARAAHPVKINTSQLADIMQSNCTVKHSDILAVLQELADTIRLQLQDSKSVRIDNLGTFKVGLRSSGSETVKDFNVKKHIKSLHIIFQPETIVDTDSGKHIKKLLQGASVRELPKNAVVNEPDNEGTDPQEP